jgi:hypothetical protein
MKSQMILALVLIALCLFVVEGYNADDVENKLYNYRRAKFQKSKKRFIKIVI